MPVMRQRLPFVAMQLPHHLQALTAGQRRVSILLLCLHGLFKGKSNVSNLVLVQLLEAPTAAVAMRAHASGLGFGFSQFAVFSVYALAFWYGGQLIRAGEMTFSQVLKVRLVHAGYGHPSMRWRCQWTRGHLSFAQGQKERCKCNAAMYTPRCCTGSACVQCEAGRVPNRSCLLPERS